MKEVYEFLKKCETYYIATIDGDQPRVRPFGTIDIFEDRFYIQTGKAKYVSKQIHANPKLEICAMAEGKWIRIEAIAVEDDSVSARQHMLDAFPALERMYAVNDGNMEVFYLTGATAIISSVTGETQVIKF